MPKQSEQSEIMDAMNPASGLEILAAISHRRTANGVHKSNNTRFGESDQGNEHEGEREDCCIETARNEEDEGSTRMLVQSASLVRTD